MRGSWSRGKIRGMGAHGAVLLAAACALSAGCNMLQVTTDYDPSADFGRYQTYAWLDQPASKTGDYRLDSPLLAERLKRAIDEALPGRGLVLAEPEQADLLVGYHLTVQDKVDVTTIDRHYGYGAYWRYGGGAGYSETYVSQYEQGTLVIDLVDTRSERLVWRGAGQSRLKASTTPEESEERARNVVSHILFRFPPKGGSGAQSNPTGDGDGE